MKYKDKLWVYLVLPPLVLNFGALLTYGAYYALVYTRPELVAGIHLGFVRLAMDVLIILVEWIFALVILLRLRKAGIPLIQFIAEKGSDRRLRLLPTLLLFLIWNILFAVYLVVLSKLNPSVWESYQGLPLWVRLGQLLSVPATAAFCEELIWRAYIPAGLAARSLTQVPVLLVSSLSFSMIHGIFLPDRLLVTFLLGLVAGIYFLKERNLLPVMITHWFVDVWSFGLFIFS